MASSWEEKIYSKELEFEGRHCLIYYQKKIEGDVCALVAIANVLSLMNKLGSTSKAKTMNDLRTLVAAQLRMNNGGQQQHQQRRVDDAVALIPRLAARIDVNLNFRRIHEFDIFEEHEIFKLLRIPIFHAWKVPPPEGGHTNGSKSSISETGKEKKGDRQELEVLQKAAQVSFAESTLVSPEEKKMIEKKYTTAKFTRHGYVELLEALSKEEHGLCVFYWNGCFNTMCKKNEELYVLATNKDEPLLGWKKLDEIKLFLKSSIRQPEISVAAVSLDEVDLTCLKDAMLCGKLKDEMQPFKMELDIMDEESLSDVIDLLGQGFHYDLIVMNYSFVKEETARDKKWVESLKKGGFIGEMAALVWPGDVPEDEFDSLVVTDRYMGVDDENEGVTLVRSDCMEEPEEFAEIFGALIKQAIWNRVVLGGEGGMLNT